MRSLVLFIVIGKVIDRTEQKNNNNTKAIKAKAQKNKCVFFFSLIERALVARSFATTNTSIKQGEGEGGCKREFGGGSGAISVDVDMGPCRSIVLLSDWSCVYVVCMYSFCGCVVVKDDNGGVSGGRVRVLYTCVCLYSVYIVPSFPNPWLFVQGARCKVRGEVVAVQVEEGERSEKYVSLVD